MKWRFIGILLALALFFVTESFITHLQYKEELGNVNHGLSRLFSNEVAYHFIGNMPSVLGRSKLNLKKQYVHITTIPDDKIEN